MKRMISFLRHAKSDWHDGAVSDHERPLNGRGRQACETMAAYMTAHTLRPDIVLCSDARRTQETTERLLAALAGDTVTVRADAELYLASHTTILKKINQLDDSLRHVLVVAHYPGIAAAALDVSGNDPAGASDRITKKFPTAALACVTVAAQRWADVTPASGTLTAFVTPKGLQKEQ